MLSLDEPSRPQRGFHQARWRKSSRSLTADDCVEVAVSTTGRIGIRDSKAPSSGLVTIAPHGWRQFLGRIKKGELDLPPA
ncbi:DUF397 domain-containing protein [Actinomadura geliboluensis]|uniref:DUF397 domain-containing protein n=1 Tax=Actinomadura geliboluensis TaxID=882440 RepID=A0A5S4H669_9ACTN|nr:DUF397 domain-containing protein [Actinomadura geliboluensis]TMR40244.1 DUF397 domain-containing protein [Actinomadura geliboluensis]